MRLGEVVGFLGGGSFIVAAISAYVSSLVAQRIQSKWRRDEQVGLERVRDELSQNRLALECAISRQGAGGDLAQQRRLEAVLELWGAVLVLRNNLSLPTLVNDILLPEEYDSALIGDGAFAASARDLTDEYLHRVVMSVDGVESLRPLLGDKLWLTFYIYRAVRGRAVNILTRGISKGHVEDPRADNGIRQLLSYVLPPARLDEAYTGSPIGFLRRALDGLEVEILREIELVVSGERTSVESYEIAAKLRAAGSQSGV